MLIVRRFSVNKLLIPEVLGNNIIIPVSLQRVHNIKQMLGDTVYYGELGKNDKTIT